MKKLLLGLLLLGSFSSFSQDRNFGVDIEAEHIQYTVSSAQSGLLFGKLEQAYNEGNRAIKRTTQGNNNIMYSNESGTIWCNEYVINYNSSRELRHSCKITAVNNL